MDNMKSAEWNDSSSEQKTSTTCTANTTSDSGDLDLRVCVKREKPTEQNLKKIIVVDDKPKKHIDLSFLKILLIPILIILICYLIYNTWFKNRELADLSKFERSKLMQYISYDITNNPSNLTDSGKSTATYLKSLGVDEVSEKEVKDLFQQYVNDDTANLKAFGEQLAATDSAAVDTDLDNIEYDDLKLNGNGITYGYHYSNKFINTLGINNESKSGNEKSALYSDIADGINSHLNSSNKNKEGEK